MSETCTHERDDNPLSCPSCGIPYVHHMGLVDTCRELIAVDAKLQKLEELLTQHHHHHWKEQAEQERDRYKEELQKLKKSWIVQHGDATIESDAYELAQLTEERDRYKEALERIYKTGTHICEDPRTIAKNALLNKK